jgi:hypothetical protein
MTLIIIILVLLLSLALFYLKCSLMQSIMTLWSAILATIIAFSYYEWAADFLISRGKGMEWALAGCFVVLFVFAFVIFRAVSDLLAPGSVDLGDSVKLSVSLICGFLTGLIISGNLLVVLGLAPMQGTMSYSRFDPSVPVVLSSPRKPMLNPDGFVAGLYSWISSGSMSSGKSFGVLHTDYLSQIHLNTLKAKEQVASVCSSEALILPTGKTKKPVRYKTIDDRQLTIVRAGVRANMVEDGGAANKFGMLDFFPAQIRMIVRDSGGKATVLHPVGILKNGRAVKWELNQIIKPDQGEVKNRIYWVDLAFECSKDKKPVLLSFKQNAIVELPEAVDSTPEIERALDDEGSKE